MPAKLEDLRKGTLIKGLLLDGAVTVVDVSWFGDNCIELTYKTRDGRTGAEMVYRDKEVDLDVVAAGESWSFDAPGDLLRLSSEAHRIRLAYLFDPFLAVHTSLIRPLPHQIEAVYGEMLSRQPLRFLLADDPGAGKTIMAGLLIRELIVRGDLDRCLIICPGSLAEQWQDELFEKFNLNFDLLTRDKIESSASGNPFDDLRYVVARLDHMSRNDELLEKLRQSHWDMVIVDEAHKMSATYFGNEVKYTKRYKLGQLVGGLTRHLLLMTATPHNGKETDFQLFMALLDGDRFEGKFRDGVHSADTSDMMRRMIKEKLVKFDGKPLFPERRAYTVSYRLSDAEAALYKSVTDYVRDEFNRAEKLAADGRRGTVGFALTILQRRLASSPEAIYQSLHRRRQRLEKRMQEEELLKRGATIKLESFDDLPDLTEEDLDELDDAPDSEIEAAEELVMDRATAAQTIQELKIEIAVLRRLEQEAEAVLRSGTDTKWEQLSALLQDRPEMFDSSGNRRKIVIFTEHRDTLNYLESRIRTLTGRPESVVCIHGGLGREKRRQAASQFTHEADVQVLLATDAAGEGINLQRAHLMANYDLPWNPNRLEQRFGRIHRIGQTEVCHLWNLVAGETREGQVMQRLCEKIEQETKALNGQVFDVLGKAFGHRSLRDLLMDAIRYGDDPDVRQRLNQVVDHALDHENLRDLVEDHALANDVLDDRKLRRIRDDMERNDARRLQPRYVQTFFLEAFQRLGGTIREREPNRFEIRNVPAVIRARDREIGTRDIVLAKYERITFDKELIGVQGKPPAAFVCPGHPLLTAVIDLVLERYGHLMKQGAVLVDPLDIGETPRILVYLEHAIRDARTDAAGNYRTLSRRLQFTEIAKDGSIVRGNNAPYLDYRPTTVEEVALLKDALVDFRSGSELEKKALGFAIEHMVPAHLQEVKARNGDRVVKTMAAVKARLTAEITHWDNRAEDLRLKERAGKTNFRLNSAKAAQRRDDLQARLTRRLNELEREQQIAALPPVIVGGALVVPAGLLARLSGKRPHHSAAVMTQETERIEMAGMQAVAAVERSLGNEPIDVSEQKCGYDIESRPPEGHLRFIEVKGRIAAGHTITVTRNEMLTALNKPESFILAIVQVPESDVADPYDLNEEGVPYGPPTDCTVHYIRNPFDKEPAFGATASTFKIRDLLSLPGAEQMI